MAAQPELSVIIVNWNVCDLLDTCLKTLYQYTKSVTFEAIVVDSASADGSVEMVRKKYPQVQLVASPENLGFTRGNNTGLKLATGKHILYLNPDIELIEDALGPLYCYLEEHAQVGALGCKLLNSDRSHQNSIGSSPSLKTLWNEYVLRQRMEGAGLVHPDTPTPVDFVLGACLLVRGEIARQLGGFDERYFMYQEEADLCLSVRRLGLEVIYDPEVAMIHHGSKSATKSVESRQRTFHENRKSQYLFIRKHYSRLAAMGAWLLLTALCLARIITFGIQWLILPKKRADLRFKLRYSWATLRWLV